MSTIIPIDKLQLSHSIKQVFGESINVEGYLSKFIDYSIDLPRGNLKNCMIV